MFGNARVAGQGDDARAQSVLYSPLTAFALWQMAYSVWPAHCVRFIAYGIWLIVGTFYQSERSERAISDKP